MTADHSAYAWDRLSLFLSRDILKRRYKERHGGQLSSTKALEIISHLDQARQYFKSAESAGVLAGPLEQYYGVLAFSRAIILYLNPSLRETSLKKGHGISALLPSDGCIEDIRLEISAGTFTELIDATRNEELASWDLPAIGMVPDHRRAILALPRPPADGKFGLIDLLARIPDLRKHFEEALATPAHCYAGRVHWFMGSLTVAVWRDKFDLPTPDAMRDALGIKAPATAKISPNLSVEISHHMRDGAAVTDYLPAMFTSKSGDHGLVERFPDGWWLNEVSTYFAASHVLSMLVRYFPSRWASMVNHENGDRIFPVLDRMRALIQSEFVRVGMWAIEQES